MHLIVFVKLPAGSTPDDIEAAMKPFEIVEGDDGEVCQGKFDNWRLGGRWKGGLQLKPERRCAGYRGEPGIYGESLDPVGYDMARWGDIQGIVWSWTETFRPAAMLVDGEWTDRPSTHDFQSVVRSMSEDDMVAIVDIHC